MDHPFKSPVILSYCTGFRGLERGIERAIGSIRTAVYVEIEAFIIENLLVGMEKGVLDAAPIWPNIKTFDARPFRDRIHGIIGGYPCQPFSMAGNRKGTDDPRHLWPYLERDIRAVRPLWCFFENVSGHLSLGFSEVRQSLSDMGYAVEAGIFTAEEVGAPHRRERLFILAIRRDCLGYAKHNGSITTEKLRRGNETSHWSTKRKIAPSESSGADRPDSIRGLSKSKLGDTNCTTNRIEPSGLYTETTRTGKILGDPNSDGNQNRVDSRGNRETTSRSEGTGEQRQRIWVEPTPASENELANACNIGCKHRRNNWQKRHIQRNIGFAKENKPEWKRWGRGACKACTNMTRRKENELADSKSIKRRLSKSERRQCNPNIIRRSKKLVHSSEQHAQRLISKQFNKSIGSVEGKRPFRSSSQWPARPGGGQYDWEQPRTVKPGVGSTIDGYSFREDLLRALGNSVVEQSAELAFNTLLKTHLYGK